MLTYMGSRSSRFRFFVVLLALVAVVGLLIERAPCVVCLLGDGLSWRVLVSIPGTYISDLAYQVGVLGTLLVNAMVAAAAFYILFLISRMLRKRLSR